VYGSKVGELAGTADHLRDVDAVANMSRDELESHAKTLRAVSEITDALLAAVDVRDVFRRTLDAVAAFTHFPGVAVFALDASGERLDLIGARGFGAETVRAARWLPVEGSLTGIAIRRRELVTSDDIVHDPRGANEVRQQLEAEGFTGTASVPLLIGARPVGALNLIYRGGIGLTAHERDLLTSLAKVVAVAVERARHLERLEAEIAERARGEHWRTFLGEASLALASSLDFEETLARVVRLAVRSLAAWCVVDLVQPDGELRRLAGAHADAAQQPLVDALVSATRLDKDASEGVALVIKAGKTVVRELGDEQLRPGGTLPVATSDVEHLRRLRELGGRSFMIVPLPSRGRILGSICFVSAEPGHYTQRDVARAEVLAARCAAAIDNAALYREAREAIAARDVFLSIASHELKTPLTALHLTLQSLSRRAPDDPWSAPRLALASQQVARLTRLIDSLLDVSRITAGRLELEPEDVELGELVAEVAARFRDEATRAGCELRLAAEAPVRGRWDRLRLDQVVSNLISNAIKYGAGAPIECTVSAVGVGGVGGVRDEAHLHVRDRGIGIAKGDLVRVFERFERAVSPHHYGGLGLGLHIASEIVRAHDGAISVASEPGEGATFRVTLPIGARSA
jgi:signal transduction histidine kinase